MILNYGSAASMPSYSQVLEALSADQSAPIISRLSRLYDDMHEALVPVLLPSNPVMITLSSPLPPTSSPLRSSRNFLQNILCELRKYCAAARDSEVDTMLNDLSASFNFPHDEQDGRLPYLIVQTIRSIFTLAQEMASDLRNFALANLTESEVIGLITSEARRREVECVTRLYGGRLGVLRTWNIWLQLEAALEGNPVDEIAPKSQDTPVTARNWKKYLLKALSTPVPISIVPPPMTELPPEPGALPPESGSNEGGSSRKENDLPAVFLVSVPSLFRIQNLLQAIVISACLRLLVRSGSNAADKEADFETFTSRVWILLLGEVEGHEQRARPEANGADMQLRLANLEDEVWQLVRRRLGTGSATSTATPDVPLQVGQAEALAHEENVRANVRRLLRTEDPVFTLFMRRLILAFEKWFEAIDETSGTTKGMQDGTPTNSSGLSHVPSLMKTGRALPWSTVAPTFSRTSNTRGGDTPSKDSESVISTHVRLLPEIKGFEGDVLRRAFEGVAGEIHSATSWIEETWGDILMMHPPSRAYVDGYESGMDSDK